MFGGKLQLRVRSKQWPLKLHNKDAVRREDGWVRYLIGSGETAYLRSEAPGLAKEHCWIAWDGIQAKVIPCAGAQVQVNGKSVTHEQVLIAGDVVQLGELVLRLVVLETSSGEDFSKTDAVQQHPGDSLFERALEEALFGQASVASEKGRDGQQSVGPSKATNKASAAKHGPDRSLPPASSPKPPNSISAADQALTKLFEQRLAEQKRVKPRRPG
jgi:hypothetical protein